jgi:hypothetical protein
MPALISIRAASRPTGAMSAIAAKGWMCTPRQCLGRANPWSLIAWLTGRMARSLHRADGQPAPNCRSGLRSVLPRSSIQDGYGPIAGQGAYDPGAGKEHQRAIHRVPIPGSASASPVSSTGQAATATIKVKTTIPVVTFPLGVAVNPKTNTIYPVQDPSAGMSSKKNTKDAPTPSRQPSQKGMVEETTALSTMPW